MSSYQTHNAAMSKVIAERQRDVAHHLDYFTAKVTKIRELKLRKALGEKTIYDRSLSSYDIPIDKLLANEIGSMKYAHDCVRRSRKRLWEVYKLQQSLRYRERPHD